MLAALALALFPQDSLDFPRVEVRVTAAVGVPAVTETEVYTSGYGLLRFDRKSLKMLGMTGLVERGADVAPPFTSPPTVTRDRVIVRRTEDGAVVAFDRELEKEVWVKESRWQTNQAPGAEQDGRYVFADDRGLTAVEVSTGEELWHRKFDGGAWSTPVFGDGLVFVGTDRGTVHALQPATGESVWDASGFGSFVAAKPTYARGALYIADRGVRGSETEDNAPFDSSTEDWSGPRAGALHAFDGLSGDHLWGRVFGATGSSKPFVTDDGVLLGFGRSVARFDRETGAIDPNSVIPTGRNPFGSPTRIGERVYFGNLDGALYVHDAATRELVWEFRVPNAEVHDFVHTGDRAFVATTRGLFILGREPGEHSGKRLVWGE